LQQNFLLHYEADASVVSCMPTPAQPPKPRAKLEAHLRLIAKDEGWPMDRPLPTTRDLAAKFGPSAATVFRLLQQLEVEGALWQHSSGRFYRAAARALLDRPKPVACLIRRLELCSALYRELLEGISAGAGTAKRAMLLWHDDVLVNHADPEQPPAFAGAAAQRVVLDAFLERHGTDAGGFVLDHLWSDAVLKRAGDRLLPGVLLFRKAPQGSPLANVRADFDAAATQALAHLLGRGFTRLVPVEPFASDPAVEEFLAALAGAADALGCSDRLAPVARAHRAEDRAALIASLPRKERTALIVPEDHVAVRLRAMLAEKGRACPESIGLLAVMGTDVAGATGITRLAFDFRAMGRAAVALLQENSPKDTKVFAPRLDIGSST
jgi:hypothetical protein